MNHAMAADAPRHYGRNQARRTSMILWLGVVSANLVGLFAAVYVSSYLRAGAGDPDILFIFYYGALLLAAVADALWIDEVLFKGAFRRTIQGRTIPVTAYRHDGRTIWGATQRITASLLDLVIAIRADQD